MLETVKNTNRLFTQVFPNTDAQYPVPYPGSIISIIDAGETMAVLAVDENTSGRFITQLEDHVGSEMTILVKSEGGAAVNIAIVSVEFFFAKELKIDGRAHPEKEMILPVIEIVLGQDGGFNRMKGCVIVESLRPGRIGKPVINYFVSLHTVIDRRGKVQPALHRYFHTHACVKACFGTGFLLYVLHGIAGK